MAEREERNGGRGGNAERALRESLKKLRQSRTMWDGTAESLGGYVQILKREALSYHRDAGVENEVASTRKFLEGWALDVHYNVSPGATLTALGDLHTRLSEKFREEFPAAEPPVVAAAGAEGGQPHVGPTPKAVWVVFEALLRAAGTGKPEGMDGIFAAFKQRPDFRNVAQARALYRSLVERAARALNTDQAEWAEAALATQLRDWFSDSVLMTA